jgi:CBS domain-containing protein
VIKGMVGLKIHQLFVVDEDGTLTGVISALDVLRHLGSENADLLQATIAEE